MATKYKPVDHDINVKDKPEYGTKDNDIFHITSGTEDGVQIYPKNQATDKITFDGMNLTSINATHIEKTKDIKLTYVVGSTEKTLIIKDYFSSTKATAPKSSLKNIRYSTSDANYDISIANDLLFSDLYTVNENKHKVTGSNFADKIDLIAETSSYTVNGGKGNDYIIGTNDDDTLNGENGDDTICGKKGNDILTGGKGTNTYAYDAGASVNGNDTVKLTKGEIAKINYAGDSSKIDYKLDNKGNTLIYFDKTDENSNYITLKDFAKKDSVNEIKFISTDKTENLKDVYWNYAPTDDYKGTYLNEHIDAKGITTAKTDKRGNPLAYSFNTGSGDDIIESTNFGDKITAGIGKNEIKYSSLTQLSGDTIYLTKNEKLTIDLTEISNDNATATYTLSGKNLVVTVNDGSESASFTIANYGTKNVVGANGRVILIDKNGETDLKEEAMVTVDGLKGTFHNDTINGNDGNNTIKGGDGDDTIYGGAGNDKIYGEAGLNTIVFKVGDGVDTVYSGKGTDALEFSDVSMSNLQFSRGTGKNKNDLIIKYSENDSVTVKNYYAVDKKTQRPTTSVKYIVTTEGNFYVDPSKFIFGTWDINGDDNDNVIFGSNLSDTIKAFGGNDVIYGNLGDDKIYGDNGYDYIYGGGGNDIIYGGEDNDSIYGGDGEDTIYGGTEDDFIYGGDGADQIYGEEDDDLIYGNEGADIIDGGAGDDDIYGGDDDDTIDGDAGEDIIYGDDGSDIIYGGDDDDTIDGGAGEDIIYGDDGSDTIYGGDDADKIDGGAGEDIIYGDNGSDIIYGDDGSDTIYGGAGEDTIYGGDDADTIYGGDQVDTIYGGDGIDTIYAGTENDTIYGGNGDDIIYGENGRDKIYGGAGSDTIYGGDGRDDDDDIYTGTGDDIIYAGGGNSINVTLVESGNKTIVSGNREGVTDKGYDIVVFLNEIDLNNLKGHISGDDLVVSDSTGSSVILKNYFTEGHRVDRFQIQEKGGQTIGIDKLPIEIISDASEINGTKLNDIITATNNKGVVINGYKGKDTIYDGAGNDVINGGEGDDTIYSSLGNDIINVGTGTNTIVIGTGNKTIENGGGVDTIVFNDEINLDNIIRFISGNNLVVIDSNGNSATLPDYFQKGHSVKTVKVGDKTKSIDDVPVQAPNNYIVGTRNDDTLNGSANDDVIYGCEGNDTINGNAGNDTIIGGMGNDSINGGDGNDVIDSGTGDDTINGGSGSNVMYLDAGNKIITNGGGNDTLVFNNETNIDNLRGHVRGNSLEITDSKGTSVTLSDFFSGHSVSNLQVGYMTINIADLPNIIKSDASEINGTILKDIITATNPNGTTINGYAGNDTINGGNGDDTIYGGTGTDTISGDTGNDTIYGGDDADIIYGNAGADIIYGENGDDNMYGGDDNDTIYSGTGADFISGGAGDNTIYLDAGNKTITNGGGVDTLVFSNETDINNLEISVSGKNLVITDDSGTSVTLSNYSDGHSVSTLQVGDDIVKISDLRNSIESGEQSIHGTFFHDVITATNNNWHEIYGREGDDTIYGGDGSNYIYGDYDQYSSNIGHDTIYGGASRDHLFGRRGNDTIYGGGGNDEIWGDDDKDTLYGDDGDDVINGGADNDTIYGGNGGDTINGGNGDDTLYGDSGNDTINGDAGIDTIYGGLGNDILRGGADSDKYIQEDLSSYHDEIYDYSGDNDSIEIGVNKANIIIRYDVKIDAEGHIIEDESKNMYITNTADFGDTAKGVKVTDQFVSGHSIESIKTADNYTLTTTQISALRSAIATWLSGSQYDSVQAVLNSGDTDVIGGLIVEFQNAAWQGPNS